MKTIEWGFLIVNYLFLGGLSAGLFFVSALATFLYKIDEPSPYTRIARLGALLAPWPVMIGCVLLIFDLGRWYRLDRKSTRLNSSHGSISYAVFCLKKKNIHISHYIEVYYNTSNI